MATARKPQAKRKKRVGSSKSARVAGARSKPKVKFDLEDLENLASVGNTPEDMAPALGVDPRTLYRHMASDPSVQAAIDAGRSRMRRNLRTAGVRKAVSGDNTMLIWYGKQPTDQGGLGQRDVRAVEVTGSHGGPLELQSDLQVVLERKLQEFIHSKRGGGDG